MIVYLDNHMSVRPGWKPPARAARLAPNLPRPSGLNENLAREILELHTLGVNGGYTQADVTQLARALTGWTVGGLASPGFTFQAGRHDPGAKTIVGRSYAQEGMAQAEAALADLAAHPSTARHIATKLARHFIADEPPPAAVERIARAFRDSGGHLPTVHAALLDCPEAWQAPLAKLKSPVEYVVSCLRCLPAARAAKPQALFYALNEMGQRPYFAPSPQGWPDSAQAWAGADALWKRIEWAGILASRLGSGVDPLAIARDGYGEALSEPTRASHHARRKPAAGARAVARQPRVPEEIGMTTRRAALRTFGGLAALAAFPGLALGAAPGSERRLVLVFLRGGMDGLSAVPAYGDADFVARRGLLAIAPPGEAGGALKLDALFGLSPYLPEMHKLYEARELAVLHAVATPYRERSHFDAQNLLENGTARPFGRDAGWLNVALAGARRRGRARARLERAAGAARARGGELLLALGAAGARRRPARAPGCALSRRRAAREAVRGGARGAGHRGRRDAPRRHGRRSAGRGAARAGSGEVSLARATAPTWRRSTSAAGTRMPTRLASTRR